MTTKHTPGPWKMVKFWGDTPSIEIRSDRDSINVQWLASVPLAMPAGSADPGAAFDNGLTADQQATNAALKAAKEVLDTAGKYFPSSIKNADRFGLLNVLANSVNPAIAKATGEE